MSNTLITKRPQSDSKKFYTVITICFLIMILFGQLPSFGQVTVVGMRIMGIFLGCIFGWLFGYITSVSFMGLIMMGLYIPGQSISTIFPTAYGAFVLLMVFWAMIFCYGLSKCGLLSFVSQKILSMKWSTKSPWHLAVALWIASFICAALTGQSFAVMLLMFNVYYDIAERVGAKKRSAYSAFVLVFIAVFSAISIAVMPYSSAILTPIALMLAIDPTISYSLPLICFINLCLTLAAMIIAALVMKILMRFVLKPDFTMENAGKLVDGSAKMDKKVKWGFVYIAVMLIIMLLPTFLPTVNPVAMFLNRVGSIGVFAVVVLFMCLTTVDGERILDLEDAMLHGGMSWTLYFMLATAMAASSLLVSADAGISATLTDALGGFMGGTSPYVIALLMLVIGLILTNCINNAIAMQLLTPIMVSLLVMTGINPACCVGLVGVVLDHGLILPSGSPLGAFLHGNSAWMSSGQVYSYTAMGALCLTLAIAVVGLPIALFFA